MLTLLVVVLVSLILQPPVIPDRKPTALQTVMLRSLDPPARGLAGESSPKSGGLVQEVDETAVTKTSKQNCRCHGAVVARQS